MLKKQARRRWRLTPEPPTDGLRGSGYPPLIQRLLALRALRTTTDARAFLEGHAPPRADDPFLLPNMEAAVRRLRRALEQGETVAVFGDFDVDGVTAAALLCQGLGALGAKTIPYIPDRFRDGYGLNVGAVESLRRQGATLLLAADCGTSSLPEIERARSLGMAVVVLDHHSVPQELPAVEALVNPRLQGDRGPYADLAAVGIAYLVLMALYDDLAQPFPADQYLDLVALGTVVDMARLVGENRHLVRRGLSALAQTGRPGLRALMAVAGVDPARIDAQHLSFALGPRLNAAGRLEHASLSYELLVCEEPEKAQLLAERLNELNRERQRRQAEAIELALGLLSEDAGPAEAPIDEAPLIMLGHPAISCGIVGLVAAKLAEEFYRPTVVYELGENESRASARSIPEFDIASALRRCADLFERFGGHRQAAGFTAANDRLPLIRERLLAIAGEELTGQDLTPTINIDAELPLRELRGAEIRLLGRFGPHGIGNPEPTFLSRGVRVLESWPVGSPEEGHRRLKLRDGPVVWPAIAFSLVDEREGEHPVDAGPAYGEVVDLVYTVTPDRRISDGLELHVLDIRQSQQDPRPPS
jgi:single-stranded-DNA-specific exonuclease